MYLEDCGRGHLGKLSFACTVIHYEMQFTKHIAVYIQHPDGWTECKHFQTKIINIKQVA